MSKKLFDGLKDFSTTTRTENLAKTYTTSLNHNLDLFALGGALRTRRTDEVLSLFTKAYSENPLLAMKNLFYIRDIRGGMGERKTFRTIINYIANTPYSDTLLKNIHNIPEFGRWDDLYSLVDTKIESKMFEFMIDQAVEDVTAENPSLLGKWLKSENTSSKESKRLARKTRLAFELTHTEYRQLLSSLRKRIGIIERLMCANKWGDIEYDKITSKAGMIYRKAFHKHDGDRYREYLDAVEKGEKKINVRTLFPYEILRIAWRENDRTADLQWANLPNYLPEGENAIAVVDTSGSMTGLGFSRTVEPILIALSLGIYFAERSTGYFKNHFITFSAQPQLQEIIGSTLHEKAQNLSRAHWQMNTNLQAVFSLILTKAVQNNLKQEDIPDKIYIISDMEFDSCCYGSRDVTNFEKAKLKFNEFGYKLPTLVFWNVESRQDNIPVRFDEKGVVLVSGASPSIFKMMESGTLDPLSFMLFVLNTDRYISVKI